LYLFPFLFFYIIRTLFNNTFYRFTRRRFWITSMILSICLIIFTHKDAKSTDICSILQFYIASLNKIVNWNVERNERRIKKKNGMTSRRQAKIKTKREERKERNEGVGQEWPVVVLCNCILSVVHSRTCTRGHYSLCDSTRYSWVSTTWSEETD